MDRGIPFFNKQVKKRQQQRVRQVHLDHLRFVRPSTTTTGEEPQINNKKKQQLMENRFTEIERENRILLQKITGIMSKKRAISSQIQLKDPSPKSLNVTFRRKQYQEIEIQNAKMLKRLQQKKSDYEVTRLKKDWRRNKYVIRNISNYPFILEKGGQKETKVDRKRESQQKANTGLMNKTYHKQYEKPIEISKYKLIDGYTFLVTIRLDNSKLVIFADEQKPKKEAKIIQITKNQAMDFLAHECQNKIQKLFDHLKYDGETQTLYLVGEGVEDDKDDQQDLLIKQNHSQENQRSQHDQPPQPTNRQSQENKHEERYDQGSKQLNLQTGKIDNKHPIENEQQPQDHFGELIEEKQVKLTQQQQT